MYGILMITFNALIIFLLVMIIFNYILNIPFNLSLLGIVSIGLKQRKRSIPKVFNNNSTDAHRKESTDRISGETLTRLLDVCSKALNTTQSARVISISNVPSQSSKLSLTYEPKMSRSSSTGRLPNL